MTLEEGLFRKLNDPYEPLPKRLKIADNAFKCPKVNFQDREFFFLKWILQEEISDKNNEAWQQCQTWLESDSFKQLRSAHISKEDINNILQTITKQFKLKDKNLQNILISVIISLIESPVFQIYLRNNVIVYMEFLRNTIKNVDDSEVLLKLLKQERLLGKKVIFADDFHKIFMEKLFLCFVNVCVKFLLVEQGELYNLLLHYIQKFVFAKRQDEFEKCFKLLQTNPQIMEDVEILNIFIANLPKSKKGNLDPLNLYFHYKLLFHAFCKSYKQNLQLVFSLFTLLVENLGFCNEKTINKEISLVNFDHSLISLVALLEVIAANNFKFDSTPINKVSFSDLVQSLLLIIMSITKYPVNENCYKVINLIIKINPLTIGAVITKLLVYLMGSNNEANELLYSDTLTNIFNVYHKLQRIENLISKTIRALQPLYLKMTPVETVNQANSLIFNGQLSDKINKQVATKYLELNVDKILPLAVLKHFSNCTTALATKQVNNLFKTLIFHLDELIGQDLAEKSKEKSYVTFIEFISRLLCHYLRKMNIASSNFRAENVIEKFSNRMDELQSVLEKFGNALLEIEHNQNLMCVFLNMSYTWGELKILMQYAISNKTISYEVSELDGTGCNISFLHSYLSSQTWCMIAERISNFGEQQCKKIMEKLWIQKIRALILSNIDKSTVNEHIATLIKTISPIEDYYEYLLSNEFSSQIILSQVDSKTLIVIADCVLKGAMRKEHVLKNVMEGGHFVLALILSIFKKMNKFFRKESKAIGNEMISCSIFCSIEWSFVDGDEYDMESLKDNFKAAISRRSEDSVVNASKLKEYLLLIRKLPIVSLERHSQMIMFSYLLGVFLDLKRCDENEEVLNELEMILLGITQTKAISLDVILPMKLMLKIIIKEFNKCEAIFSKMLNATDKDSAMLSKATDFFKKHLNNEKHIKCLLILLKYIQKNKITTNLETHQQMCNSLLPIISETYSSIHLEVLVELLQNYQPIMTDDLIKQLKTFIDRVSTDDTIQIRKGALILFQFFFNNYAKFQSDDDNDSVSNEQHFVSNVSKAMQRVELTVQSLSSYSNNVLLILQKIESLDEFKSFIDGYILKQTLTSVENPENADLQLQIWLHIISSTIKPEKGEVIKKSVEAIIIALYQRIAIENCDEKYYDILVKVLLHVIQNNQHLLTSTSLDLCFATVSQLKNMDNFEQSYNQSINILEALLRYRQPLICDRLPIFLQQYRILLYALCAKSDATKKFDVNYYEKCAEMAHLLEKLTIKLCKLQAHMASVAMYLIADIVKEYETITIYPAVKSSLNNCLYNLIPLCNKHEISCLMRVLSPGSTEIFKGTYENYKKFHRFTGKI